MPDTCVLGQGFGGNANPTYAEGGLIGHPGIDEHCGYGTPVHALYDGIAYKVLTPDRPANDRTGFTGVFQIVDDGLECFEFLTGHLTPSIQEGQPVHKHDIIGTEANHGTVFSGNIQITLAMQEACNHEGAHRHYQKRPVMPVLPSTGGYLLDSHNGGQYRDASGFYYQIFNFNNGYNGCISPFQPVFYRNLTVGMSGYDVFVLQRLLARKGFLKAQPTGFFGTQTMRAVAVYQSACGITPTSYFDPLTRSYASRELAPLPVLSNQ
jgi:Putative peptidoglycan binding domain